MTRMVCRWSCTNNHGREKKVQDKASVTSYLPYSKLTLAYHSLMKHGKTGTVSTQKSCGLTGGRRVKVWHELHCTKAEEIHNQILAERVYELKETQGGIEFMCKEIEQIARLVKVSEKDVRKWLEESLSLA